MHLKLEFDWKLTPAYDVIARMKGAERPGEWVVRGNHHDAWVFGATDPLSGTVEMLEEARGIAELTKQGWKPKRSIVFCVWDGEEPALLGSTEWAEQHAVELQQHAAVYINTDSTGRGFVEMGGSHSLELFATESDSRRAGPGLQSLRAGTRAGLHVRQDWNEAGGSSPSTRWVRAPTSRPFCSTSASPRSTSGLAGKRIMACITPTTIPTIIT